MSDKLPAIRFFFDVWECFWAGNDAALLKYGNPVCPARMPLTENTRHELKDLMDWYFLIDSSQTLYRSDAELKNIDRKVEELLKVIKEETHGKLIIKNEYGKLCPEKRLRPPYIAAERGHAKNIMALLNTGTSIYKRTVAGATPLNSSARLKMEPSISNTEKSAFRSR